MLCSPYNKSEPWKMAATLHNGTIYLSEIETEEAKERTERQTPREQQYCYWGVKFEDYMTVKGTQSCTCSSSVLRRNGLFFFRLFFLQFS